MLSEDTEYYYWPKGYNTQLTLNFTTSELSCRCSLPTCGQQRVSKELLQKLQDTRTEFGHSIKIHSAYRCAGKQQELRDQGYETAKGISTHELGRAVDYSCASRMHELLQLSKKHFKAVGAARSFIHVDTRTDKVRYWSYSIS